MDIAISCLARNNQVNIDHLFSEANPLKHIATELVLTKSLVYNSWNFLIKNNRYLSDLLVNNHVINSLFSGYDIAHVFRENPLIPEDIIRLEILSRLPLKSLMRFQCVCKSWQSLISCDPIFMKAHVARTDYPSNHRLIVRCHSTILRKYVPGNKFDHPLLSSDMVLVGSVNGLVCLYRYHWGSKSIPCIGIWNPATHRYKNVPPPLTAYDIEVTDFSFAFGFDSIKNDYKVIYLTKSPMYLMSLRNKNKPDEAGPVVADVYSCNAGSWANINVSSNFILEDGKLFKDAINVGESVYWKYLTNEKRCYVISFNIRHEIFRLFPTLDFLPNQRMAIGNLSNVLVCLVHDWVKTTYVDVYVLNETTSTDGGNWSKTYSVGPISLTSQMCIIQCFGNGDLFFCDDKQYKSVCVDPETHAVLGSRIHTFDIRCLSSAYGLGYTETLVSVMGMKHINTQKCDYLLFI